VNYSRYVELFNQSMGTFAIFEFVQSSVQIASVLVQTSPVRFSVCLDELYLILILIYRMT